MRVRVINVSKSFGIVKVLENFSLEAGEGEVVGVVGPSGTGKSTLLGIIAGLVKPDKGEVYYDDIQIFREPFKARKLVSFSFQEPTLIPYLTAEENVLIAGGDARRARELFKRFGLADKRGKLPVKLSGGERKRVDLIRALSRNTPVLVLDEPFAYLDEDLRRVVKELVAEYSREGRIIFLSYVDRREIEEVCTRVIEMG